MNDLYSLDKQLGELYNRIPLLERDNDLDSQQKEDYNNALKEFVECGKKVFGDDSLGREQIDRKIQEYAILSVKSSLTHEPQDILAMIPDMDNITSDAFMRLEYCLSSRKEDPKSFYEEDFFAKDREFLASFSEEDIAHFEEFQNYIGKTPDDVVRNKM